MMPAESREAKLQRVLRLRQWNLAILLENVADLMNVSNVFRTCEAAGIMHVLVLNNAIDPHPHWGRISSKGAFKWLHIRQFTHTDQCLEVVRKEFKNLYVSSLEPGAASLYETDLCQPQVLAFGNESRGVSQALRAEADGFFHLPMMGMSQSLNVANAAAITCYEMLRQRLQNGLYQQTTLSPEAESNWLQKWNSRKNDDLHISTARVHGHNEQA